MVPKKVIENLLLDLGWAINPENPDGNMLRAQLKLLRRSIREAYLALGYTEDDLKDYLWK